MSEIILVQDHDDVFEISFDDIKKYHGLSNIAGAAVAFKALQSCFKELYGNKAAKRDEIKVLSGHSGSGVRDAIEMVTRAVSRNAYEVDTSIPKAQLNPYRQLSFSFNVFTNDGRHCEVLLKRGVLPDRFFELIHLTGKEDLQQERQELIQLKRRMAKEIIETECSNLFD